MVARLRVTYGVGLTNTGDHKGRPYEDTEFQPSQAGDPKRVAPYEEGTTAL